MKQENNDNSKAHQIALLKQIIFTDEKEREDYSYQLHENIAQLLAAVRLHLNIAKKHIDSDGLIYLTEAEDIILESLTGIRTLAKTIYPMTLKSVGFPVLIHDLYSLLTDQKEIECAISIDEDLIAGASLNFQHIFYQVAQLQMINILKCSGITKVNFSILPSFDKIKMLIDDDGTREPDSLPLKVPGFISLKEKTEAFDGIFSIVEKPGHKGITLEVSL
jgi:signal transduction histidine kinase